LPGCTRKIPEDESFTEAVLSGLMRPDWLCHSSEV
jgi:hypothetical protein